MVGGVDALLVLLVAVNHDIAYLCAALATVGSLAGSLILFYIARRGGQAFLDKYTSGGRGARVRAWFQRYGLLTIFIPALIPIPLPLKIPVLSAGALKVRPLTFVAVFLAARIPRYAALAYLGMQLGKETLPYLKAHVWHLTGIAVALFVIL